MKFIPIALLSIFLFSLQGCNKETQEPLPSFESVAKSKQIVNANNEFAFSLFKEIAASEDKSNFMISPASASLALGMVYNGAAGDTQKAFANTLNYGDATLEETNLVNKNIIDNLTYTGSGSTFKVANSLWIRDDFPVKDPFIKLNRDYYYAETANLDFGNPQTLNTINGWASDNTQGKIPTILDNIGPDAILYAINAIYFNGEWKFRFDESKTEQRPFYTDGNIKNVPMMSMEGNLAYYENETFSSIKLPYKGDKFTMTVLLPNKDRTVADVIEVMDSDNWGQWQREYLEINLNLTMPKFLFSYKKEFNDALINMGLGIAFDPDRADFGNLSDLSTYISFVLQKTYIDVNEKGTEAAAVTAVGIGLTSVGPGNLVVLDRPFLFLITEKETGSICFMGKVGMPEYDK